MLKGSREAVLRKVQPVSVHGQLSLDVYYSELDDPDGQMRVARLGPEAVPRNLQTGDRIRLEFLVGVVTSVTKVTGS
jgi:hypothetical protein